MPSEPELQKPGGRIEPLKEVINSLEADVLALQEVDGKLAESIEQDGVWQTFWQQKGGGKSDGCLTLVHPDITVDKYGAIKFGDGSDHVAQILQLSKLALVNTHFKWSPPDDPEHKGLGQARELLEYLGDQPAVILADCNDRQAAQCDDASPTQAFTTLSGARQPPGLTARLFQLILSPSGELLGAWYRNYLPQPSQTAKCRLTIFRFSPI